MWWRRARLLITASISIRDRQGIVTLGALLSAGRFETDVSGQGPPGRPAGRQPYVAVVGLHGCAIRGVGPAR
jgi:hypothetical protein